MTKPIEKIWRQLLSRGKQAWPLHQRVDETHPIDFYAGISGEGARALVLVTPVEPSQVPSYQAFEVVKARREDGRWALTVLLHRTELASIFAHLCDDLIAVARTDCQPSSAAAFLIARLHRWHSLLGRELAGVLSSAEIRGLIGELLVLKLIADGRGSDQAARSWEGPFDAPQDFRLADQFVEVKTCSPSSPVIWISSAEQLDMVSLPIVLTAAVIEAGDPVERDTFTLASLVEQIREILKTSQMATDLFNQKLKIGGFVERPEYSRDAFKLRRFRHFEVTAAAFPKLVRSTLAPQIVSLTYQLDLSDCAAFEHDRWEV